MSDSEDEICWDRFLKEGDELYDYMIHHFDAFFDGDSIIKHFDIRPGWDDIKSFYIENIQKELISWIHEEWKNHRLNNKDNWKPFRDQLHLTSMYFGYRKMFQYNQYYFQLALENCCGVCVYCKAGESWNHFELALLGWKEENSIELKPHNFITILSNNNISNSFWRLK